MSDEKSVERAKEHFGNLVADQLARVESLKSAEDWINYTQLKPIVIGIIGGDGIGPYIAKEAERLLRFILQEEHAEGNVEFKVIEGLTIENRAKALKTIPDDILGQMKTCHVILKGPLHTPKKGDGWPNLESANVAMRRELDLFANVRPIKVPSEGIDWVFFRENTEGAYILGSHGINVTDDLAVDFKVITTQGAERILRMAFDYASRNKINRVTVVTKANVIKTSDGKFLSIAAQVAKEYPGVEWDDWFVDIMTAKLVDPKRRTHFRVVVLPNLYGDIVTDEAAEFQGGVGTAGSANIGKRYAMFEAIHGTAPRMVLEGRAEYADPSSLMRAAAMLIRHIGFQDKAQRLDAALDICGQHERKKVITGRPEGASCAEYADYVMETLQDPNLQSRWESYQ